MTNKELAVQLYIANLQANATICTSPKFSGKLNIPDAEAMVKSVKKIAEQLATIQDN